MVTRIKYYLLFIISILLLTGCDQFTNQTDAIQTSGTVEAEQVTITTEIGGRVVDVYISQGQEVSAGDILFRLDDTLFQKQREQAVAAYDSALVNIDAAEIAVSEAQIALDSSDAQIEAAQADVDLANDNLTAAELNQEIAGISLELAQLQQEHTANELHRAEQANRTANWTEELSTEFDVPGWYYQADETLTTTSSIVSTTKAEYEEELAKFETLLKDSQYQDFVEAENRLLEAQANYLIAQELRDRQIKEKAEIDNFIQALFDSAEAELESAQLEYDQAASDGQQTDVWEARGKVAALKEQYQIALDQYLNMLTGADSNAYRISELTVEQASKTIELADIQVEQAKNILSKAEAGLTIAQNSETLYQIQLDRAENGLEAAKSYALEAEIAINLIDSQIEKLTVYSPIDGTITTETIQAGEILQPGLPALNIADLESLSVTVYVSENLYGNIAMGDPAEISADSFPEQVFTGSVSYIADEAEYTPRNTQTQEERVTTVYAIKLEITTGIDELKPGMPVDVSFSNP